MADRVPFARMPNSITAPGYFAQNPAGAVTGMAARDDARRGELGTLRDQRGNLNSEISITEMVPELGGAVNIPTLVPGQVDVEGLQSSMRPTDEQAHIAITRALSRVQAGAYLPSYPSIEEAERVAQTRQASEKTPYPRLVRALGGAR